MTVFKKGWRKPALQLSDGLSGFDGRKTQGTKGKSHR